MKSKEYGIIPSKIRYDNELSPEIKLLYVEITSLLKMNGECREVDSEYFANLYNTDRNTIKKWLKVLWNKKYIDFKDGKIIIPRNISNDANSINKVKQKVNEAFFESVWNLYPKKLGKQRITDRDKIELQEYGYGVISKCIERYIEHCKDEQYIMYGSKFFKGEYKDYLDQNYLQENSKQSEDEIDFSNVKWEL